MLIGLALIVGVVLAAIAGTFVFAFVGDGVCLVASVVVGVLAAIGVAVASIPYLGSVLHGVLAGLCFFIGAGAAGTIIFPLASLGARRLGRRSFLNSDEYVPFGPEEAGEATWLDVGSVSPRGQAGSSSEISRY